MEYKRLTRRNADGTTWVKCAVCDIQDKCDFTKETCCQELQDRLAELEDKIEQGTLKEIPCNVGDTVYVAYGVSGIDEWEVKEIVIVKNDILFRLTHDGTEDYNAAWLSEAGTYLFLTREEAEQHLKELQE